MSDTVNVKFRIKVEGQIGGSFDMPRKEYKRLLAAWEKRGNVHEETDLADEMLALAPFNYFDHLMVDEMEIEEFEEKSP
jgi:hypothetical protein